jgi:hypothetical protein
VFIFRARAALEQLILLSFFNKQLSLASLERVLITDYLGSLFLPRELDEAIQHVNAHFHPSKRPDTRYGNYPRVERYFDFGCLGDLFQITSEKEFRSRRRLNWRRKGASLH